MDAVPGTSSSSITPPKKRKSLDLGALTVVEKQSILNLYKVLIQEGLKPTAVVQKIVDSLGLAISAVYRTIREYKEIGALTSPKCLGGRPVTEDVHSKIVKYGVRRIIHKWQIYLI